MMRFSGHETFPVREGWLHKGVKLLVERPELLSRDDAADYLGVGRNMGKSIRYWLEVTGLSKAVEQEGTPSKMLAPTELGTLIYDHDPYFAETGTWWALHLEVVNNAELATTWAWFFNHFARSRFTKAEVLEALRRYLELHARNRQPPSARTLERDVGCLLASYARPIPAEQSDPEEGTECPFRDLELLRYLRTSGVYQMEVERREFPPELFAYALAKVFGKEGPEEASHIEVSLGQAAGQPGGPGRAFALTAEGVFEQALRLEEAFPDEMEIGSLAGERLLRLEGCSPTSWLVQCYMSSRAEAHDAA